MDGALYKSGRETLNCIKTWQSCTATLADVCIPLQQGCTQAALSFRAWSGTSLWFFTRRLSLLNFNVNLRPHRQFSGAFCSLVFGQPISSSRDELMPCYLIALLFPFLCPLRLGEDDIHSEVESSDKVNKQGVGLRQRRGRAT